MNFIRNHLFLMVATVVGVSLAFVRLAWGQASDAPKTPPPELVGGALQVIWVLIAIGGAVVLAGLLWAIAKLIAWLQKKHSHTVWAGFIVRLLHAVEDELQLGWTDLKAGLDKARSIDSPGGAQITSGEQDRLFRIVWEGVKNRYGGFQKLIALAGKILGGDPGRIVKGIVKRRVDDAIVGQTPDGRPGPRRETVANPSRP